MEASTADKGHDSQSLLEENRRLTEELAQCKVTFSRCRSAGLNLAPAGQTVRLTLHLAWPAPGMHGPRSAHVSLATVHHINHQTLFDVCYTG